MNLFGRSQLKKEVVLQITVLLFVSGLMVFATASSDKQLEKLMPETSINRSVSNVKPSGMSGFLELTQKVFPKRKTRTWEFSYRELRGQRKPEDQSASLGDNQPPAADSSHGVLIMVAPEQSPSDFDVEDLLTWVKMGNYLLYLDNFPYHASRRLLNKISMDVRNLEPPLHDKASDPVFRDPLYTHLRTVKLSANQSLKGGRPIATVDGIAIISEQVEGKGKILIGSCPSLIDNRHLGNSESWSNFQFIHNWLDTTDGDIIFDERCHGATQGTSVYYYFLKGPAGLVLAQLVLILALAVASCHQRFGRVINPRHWRRISNLEHIEGLANTYERANARQAVLEIIWQSLRQKLCRIMQISPHESSEKLVEEIRLKKDGSAATIISCLQECEQAIQDKHLSDEKMRELVGACDKISEQAETYLLKSATASKDTGNKRD